MRQKIASITQGLRIPAVCALCHHYHNSIFAVCEQCTNLLTRIGPGCSTCRLPLVDNLFMQCGYCIKNKPAFDNVLSSYCYEEPLKTLLHDFKYQEALYLLTFMTRLMLDARPPSYQTDCLVPVPMHPLRLRERGFNQSAELTKFLAKRLKIPFDLNLCEKKTNTVAQVNLNGKHRRLNLVNAFTAKPTAYQHITLIDDLLTTGSTANELARTLKQQGVARVDVWCLARTTTI
ncbi:MAG: ComF family protein [Legionella sp.]|nr:ComF family protein [Legionella sp.]